MSQPVLAWVGLGNMGMAMATNLAEGINPAELKVFNRTLARSITLSETSNAIIEVTTTLSELASGSDIIFICLSDDSAVTSTVDSLVSVGLENKIVCDMSTVHPDTTSDIAKKLHEVGCRFVAAPVFGAPPVAIAGKLVAVTAGDPDATAVLDPFLQHMTRAKIELGDDPRLASLMKITGNTFILSMVETIAEGLVFSEISGLGVDNTMNFISTILGGVWQSYAERMLSGSYMPRTGERPGFAVDVAHKDCSHALNLAKSSKLSYTMNIMAHVQENLDIARNDERFEGRGDVSSVYGVERERAGLTLRNEAVKRR